MPILGRFFRFVESGFARRKSKTRLFRCLKTSIPVLAVLMLLFFGIQISSSCILSCVCTSPNVSFLSDPTTQMRFCSFAHSRTSLVLPDTANFTFAESAESTNVTRQSHYHPAAHSLGSANFRWIWVAQTDNGNAFRPQTFFGVIETNINDALKMQLRNVELTERLHKWWNPVGYPQKILIYRSHDAATPHTNCNYMTLRCWHWFHRSCDNFAVVLILNQVENSRSVFNFHCIPEPVNAFKRQWIFLATHWMQYKTVLTPTWTYAFAKFASL